MPGWGVDSQHLSLRSLRKVGEQDTLCESSAPSAGSELPERGKRYIVSISAQWTGKACCGMVGILLVHAQIDAKRS